MQVMWRFGEMRLDGPRVLLFLLVFACFIGCIHGLEFLMAVWEYGLLRFVILIVLVQFRATGKTGVKEALSVLFAIQWIRFTRQ